MNMDEVALKLSQRGFRHDANSNLFYKPIRPKRPCLCNDRNQLCVEYFRLGDRPYSFTVSITGQVPIADRWANLRIYNISAEELLTKLSDFEEALIRAWEALV